MLNLKTSFIPFIRNKSEVERLQSTSFDIDIVRITGDYKFNAPEKWRLWIDPGFDSFENIYDKSFSDFNWKNWITKFKGHEKFLTEASAIKASQAEINDFVNLILNDIVTNNPTIISVPQLAYTTNKKRHSLNKKLARAAGKWKEKYWPKGTFAIPAILTHFDNFKNRAESKPRINSICRSLEESNASVVWAVHSDFDDLAGIKDYPTKQFPKLIDFHEQLKDELPNTTTTCAGPYWAMNLILWARGLVDIPAVGCGSMFKYTIPGPIFSGGKPIIRIALPPLRRWYIADRKLLNWIKDAKYNFQQIHSSEEFKEFQNIENNFSNLVSNRESSITQSLEFYFNWVNQIAAVQKRVRGLYMFQDFSKAVINGSLIKDKLPEVKKLSASARSPGFIAQQLMLQCLPR